MANVREARRDRARFALSAAAAFALPAAAALVVIAVILFAANLFRFGPPPVVGRIPSLFALLLVAVSLHRVANTEGVPPAAHRFWRHIAIVAALCFVGSLIRTGDVLRGPSGELRLSIAASVVFVVALFGAVYALLRVPIGPRARGEWIRLSLDGSTVMLGATLLMWYLAFGPMLAADPGQGAVWGRLAVGAACLTALSAVVKIILAGSGPVDPDALRLLAVALLTGGVAAGAATVITRESNLPGQLAVPVIACLVILAGERQRRAVGRPDRTARRRARSYSLLPYVAVAGTYVLLVVATVGPDNRGQRVMVAGAVVLTSLVVVRQFVALRDNARLVEQLRCREEELRHQATHDALTRLANRELFGERLDTALRVEPDRDVAVLLVDLDDFKTVNDTLGHAVGDSLLPAVGDRIRDCVRPEDTVARLGGDEFAVLLRKTAPHTIDTIAERILASLAVPVLANGHKLLVQASIGIAEAGPGDDTHALLRNADIAMYAAKEHGKGGFARFVPGMAADILEHAQLGADLRHALDHGHFHLLYQPVVQLIDQRIVGVEALVRWQHPVRGLISPVAFIRAAERTGLIVPLGRWVLREACRQSAAWRTAHGDTAPASVGVNVSVRQLQEPGFADEIAEAVHDAGLRPSDLILEVTETAVLTGGRVLATLDDVRRFGVRVALDDFGTGQSSLGLIRTCPAEILKLDRSFVDGVTGCNRLAAVAAAVVQLAQALGLNAVAEGIESQEQADYLWRLGYRLGQGFHFMPPLAGDELTELLSRQAVHRQAVHRRAVHR